MLANLGELLSFCSQNTGSFKQPNDIIPRSECEIIGPCELLLLFGFLGLLGILGCVIFHATAPRPTTFVTVKEIDTIVPIRTTILTVVTPDSSDTKLDGT